MWWLAVAKQVVFRVLAACLAFIPAMMFGVAAVNKYYDYYQNWNAAVSDLTGQSAQTTRAAGHRRRRRREVRLSCLGQRGRPGRGRDRPGTRCT